MKHNKVTDQELLASIDRKVRNSNGSYANTSDLSRRRQQASYEVAMVPKGDLVAQGVSKIVSSDTAEVIEGYTALLVKLLLDNNKIAMFTPVDTTPLAVSNAQMASDVVNYCIFNQQAGWSILNTWVKSALLYGNGVLTWGWVEDFEYEFEEYEKITEKKLDQMLADPMLDIVGSLEVEAKTDAEIQVLGAEVLDSPLTVEINYVNVKLRRKLNKSGVKIEAIPPESFIIGRGDTSIQNAKFVGKVTEMSHSEVRKMWPDFKEDLSEIGDDDEGSSRTDWSPEEIARKEVAGLDNLGGDDHDDDEDEATQNITVLECWIRSDRDGDGIAELLHIVKAGSHILEEETVSYIPVAVLDPIEVVHEFYGMSMSDMVRPQMQATTAIMRGFVENVYYGNYGIKYADPNVVDFAALQNPKPKQVVATNGNPAAAVVEATPTPISPGTAGMLDFLALQKEQSTGLTKTAMGLNDTLYVSGNSEAKMSGAQSAAQVRIEHIGRRFAETGFKELCRGVLKEMKKHLKDPVMYQSGKGYSKFTAEQLMMLPGNMDLNIQHNIGENSNQNVQAKLQGIGEMLGLMAQDAFAKKFINPMSALNLGVEMISSMGKDPLDYLLDPMDEAVQKQIAEEDEAAGENAKQLEEYEMEKMELELDQIESSVALVEEEIENKRVDNIRQIYQAQTKADLEWAKIEIQAKKEGVIPPVRPQLPTLSDIVKVEKQKEKEEIAQEENEQQPQQPEIPQELMQMIQTNPQQALQVAQQMGIDLSQLGL